MVETVYFGGGTPSLLSTEELHAFINLIHSLFNCSSSLEITLESNPDDISAERLNEWKNIGINRLSIGLQSFKEDDLKWMNRAHTVEESISCLAQANEAGFTNLTVDLMYGLPNLTMHEWRGHIQRLIDANVSHISAYCLTIEPKTAIKNWVDKGKISMPTEEEQAMQFDLLVELLGENGYQQYEISNFCIPGNESKHNSNYWKNEWYLGVGPSAHSFNGTSREWNIANNTAYIKGIKNKNRNYDVEKLSISDRFNETVLTGLRTIYGVKLTFLEKIAPISADFHTKCDSFIEFGWMKKTENNVLVLTKEGRLKADFIASELFL